MRAPRCVAVPLAVAALLLGCRSSYEFRGTPVDPPQPAPEIGGANWDGESFALRDLRGRVLVVFFGYTFCPDVCPFTLAKLKRLHERLGDAADHVAIALVSVDPERDSREKLAEYVQGFDREFYGIRLEGDALEATTGAYGVAVQTRRLETGSGGYYTVDHTGTLFVIDPEGRLRLKLAHDATVDDMLSDIRYLLGESEEQRG